MRVGLIDRVKVIGDVHLGRRFINGVPLHRRGERERSIMSQFAWELMNIDDVDYVVQVGDIFDKFIVPYEVIMFAYRSIAEAAIKRRAVEYVFLRGNHDAQRDLEKVSAFDILRELCSDLENVTFVTKAPVHADGIAFIPWSPIKTAKEMVEMLWGLYGRKYDAIFGHWDIQSFGDDDHNLLPSDELAKMTKLVVTGHDHTPQEFWTAEDGLHVIVIGSMQPYAHGEESEEEQTLAPMYVTMDLKGLEEASPEFLKGRCVRVLLQPGEVLPDDIDCLQLTAKRVGQEVEDISVDMGDFDMDALFTNAFKDVDADITTEFKTKFKELRHG